MRRVDVAPPAAKTESIDLVSGRGTACIAFENAASREGTKWRSLGPRLGLLKVQSGEREQSQGVGDLRHDRGDDSLPGDERQQRQARDWVRKGFWLRNGMWDRRRTRRGASCRLGWSRGASGSGRRGWWRHKQICGTGYTAIGTVAARLCAEAKEGQILLSQRVASYRIASGLIEEVVSWL